MKINFQNKKKLQIMIFVFIAVITLGVGYAAISAINLVINGNATGFPSQNSFSVVFKSANVTTGTGTASINNQDATIAYFDVSGLSAQGDTAVATYTIKNESNGVGAEIGLKVTNTNSEYFQVTEAIEDNKLQAGDTTTATITVTMLKTPIESAVSTSITGTLTVSPLENAQATGTAGASKTAGDPESFSTDSWATIKKAVQDNNTSAYNVGDTKEVTINNVDYTVRIANKSTSPNCSNSNYSQTACGFVVEFAEIVEKRAMNSTNTNVGGWPGSELHSYLEGTFYNSLPNDLKSVIKPTRVISGYGNNGTDSAIFVSESQNLYLLSGVEVFGSDNNDTAASTTTQLEYYQGMEADATTPWNIPAYSRTYKGYNGSDGSTGYYWLRPASSNNGISFRLVSYGYLAFGNANYSSGGLAPAFRIG